MRARTRATAVVAVCAAITMLAASHASAATWHFVDVTLESQSGDVVQPVGPATYEGHTDFSRIKDDTVRDEAGMQDAFFFEPWGKRTFAIQSAVIEAGVPVECDGPTAAVGFFDRSIDPDWFTTLMSLPVGSTVPVEPGIECVTKWGRYQFDYPPYQYPNPGIPCGSASRVAEDAIRFEAPASCLAEVYRAERVNGKYVRTQLAAGVVAPMRMTATFED